MNAAELDRVESEGNYFRLHLGAKPHLIRKTLKAFEKRLDRNRFVRIHRSHIVNVDRIKESRDWFSDPTLRYADVPERIDIVLVNGDPNPNRPDLPPYGAGEASLKSMLAAIANAIYDATGVPLRRVPLPDDRVRAALKAAGV